MYIRVCVCVQLEPSVRADNYKNPVTSNLWSITTVQLLSYQVACGVCGCNGRRERGNDAAVHEANLFLRLSRQNTNLCKVRTHANEQVSE